VSRRQAEEARAALAAGGSSHQEQRRLRSITRTRDDAERRRRLAFRHAVIVVAGAVVAMAVVAVSFGLVPAIVAATGHGVRGSFIVGELNCVRRYGCTWVGTFRGANGVVVPDVAYEGILPPGTNPGQIIPSRYPGSGRAYALSGSHTWITALLLTIFAGAAVAAGLWVSPLGRRTRDPASVHGTA
jgi:hypothetical protein